MTVGSVMAAGCQTLCHRTNPVIQIITSVPGWKEEDALPTDVGAPEPEGIVCVLV